MLDIFVTYEEKTRCKWGVYLRKNAESFVNGAKALKTFKGKWIQKVNCIWNQKSVEIFDTLNEEKGLEKCGIKRTY